jgi:hypothetical protein
MREELAQLGYDTVPATRLGLRRATYFRLKKVISLVGFFVYYDLLRYAIGGPWRVRLRRLATFMGMAKLGFRREART